MKTFPPRNTRGIKAGAAEVQAAMTKYCAEHSFGPGEVHAVLGWEYADGGGWFLWLRTDSEDVLQTLPSVYDGVPVECDLSPIGMAHGGGANARLGPVIGHAGAGI
jgi:hypothetical protein